MMNDQDNDTTISSGSNAHESGRTRQTADWRPAFLTSLARTGNVTRASRDAKIDRGTVYVTREKDPEFAAAWEEALEEATDLLEEEARRRAYYGCEEPVYYKGTQCGVIKRYSDQLMITLLKAHRPAKFRENIRQELSGPDGGPIRTQDVSDMSTEDLLDIAKMGLKPQENTE
jgi:hypothetical protein